MADKVTKEVKVVTKYKATDPKRFKESYTNIVPFYEELCKGESVVLDTKSKIFKKWLNNNIITKE